MEWKVPGAQLLDKRYPASKPTYHPKNLHRQILLQKYHKTATTQQEAAELVRIPTGDQPLGWKFSSKEICTSNFDRAWGNFLKMRNLAKISPRGINYYKFLIERRTCGEK